MNQYAAIKFLGLLALSVAGIESQLDAMPILYNINFTSSSSPDANGSFTYDSAAAVGSQFSAFVVTWDGFAFNFTTAANSATVTTSCGPVTSPKIFAFLTGTPECPGSPNGFTWIGNASAPNPTFNIFDAGNPNTTDIELGASSPASVTGTFLVSGTFTTVSAATPEPSSFIMALTCGAFLVRKRRATATRKSD